MSRKKVDVTPFDRDRVPPKQNIFFTPLIWMVCKVATLRHRLKINKKGMEGLKPPFLVLANHLSFTDFYATPLAMFPFRTNFVSELEGFQVFGEWLYRQIGCLGTRKYRNDLALIRNIQRVIKRGGVLVLFPEARYSNVGTSSPLPQSVGKLAKLLKVPVVTLNFKGNYLKSPVWNTEQRNGIPLEADLTRIFTVEELKSASVDEVNEKIGKFLEYDEYALQKEKGLEIDNPKRAEGLENVLYKCPACLVEQGLKTKGKKIFCVCCGEAWEMTKLGQLEHKKGYRTENTRRSKSAKEAKAEFYRTQVIEAAMKMADTLEASRLEAHQRLDFTGLVHIPDWYEWQRERVKDEVDGRRYFADIAVQVESLPNAVNFIDLGEGRLRQDSSGFHLLYTPFGEKAQREMYWPPESCFSVHTEYNYRNKGCCIVLSVEDDSFFLFPLEIEMNVTKMQMAAEYMYELSGGK